MKLNIDIANGTLESISNDDYLSTKRHVAIFTGDAPQSVLAVATYVDRVKNDYVDFTTVLLVTDCGLSNPYNKTTTYKMDMSKDIITQLQYKAGVQNE